MTETRKQWGTGLLEVTITDDDGNVIDRKMVDTRQEMERGQTIHPGHYERDIASVD